MGAIELRAFHLNTLVDSNYPINKNINNNCWLKSGLFFYVTRVINHNLISLTVIDVSKELKFNYFCSFNVSITRRLHCRLLNLSILLKNDDIKLFVEAARKSYYL